ncbi:acyltransferase [uncultured Sphingomonas sp.]|uniref:acyltransferase family protein n=1 Tax=uncultured Sphingomonas sp. TaxID=158754 RepID=UPI0025E1A0CF|nr:acyltransferase [uncultured Sphingomonas sp.]
MGNDAGAPAGVAKNRHRFLALDSLRGICACMIVFFHLRTTGVINNSHLIRNSWLFVDFFFVLSGFVIGCGYLDKLRSGYSVRRFLLLRLGRVYPLHALVLIAFVVMEIGGLLIGTAGLSARVPFSEPRTLPELASALALVQIFSGFPSIVWNGPSWSIAAEVWTYLLMALVLRAAPTRAPYIMAALALGSASLLALGGGEAWNPATPYAFARCVFGFSLGMLAWQLFARMAMPAIGFLKASALELAVAIGACAMVASGMVPLAAPLLFTAAVLLFAAERGIVSRLLTLRPFLLLGTLSYSIYMIHTLVIARGLDVLTLIGRRLNLPLVESSFGSDGTIKVLAFAPDVMAFVVLGVVVLCALLTYRWVEAPARAAVRAWIERADARRSRLAVAAPADVAEADLAPYPVAAELSPTL